MNTKIVLCAVAVFLGSTSAVFGQAEPPTSKNPMSFFITSKPPGSGNLGGLAGADRVCQELAAAAGAGGRTWRAYLSQESVAELPRVNARDRIGAGPWYNAKGQLIAANVADLHGDDQRDRIALTKWTALTEKGEYVPAGGDPMPSEHDIMTGTDSRGYAFTNGLYHTCKNWTSDANDDIVVVGHHDRTGVSNTSWNSSHTVLCNPHPAGRGKRFYCFAAN